MNLNNVTDIRQLAVTSGVMAAGIATDSEIVQVRWPTANTGLLVILDLKISVAGSGTAFAAGNAVFRAMKSTAWTVTGTGGGLATLTGNNAKLHTFYASAPVPEIRTASTAALGAGTKTFDAEYFAGVIAGVSAAAGDKVLLPYTLYNCRDVGDNGIIFDKDEGFSIRTIVPATGTWGFVAQMTWGVINS